MKNNVKIDHITNKLQIVINWHQIEWLKFDFAFRERFDKDFAFVSCVFIEDLILNCRICIYFDNFSFIKKNYYLINQKYFNLIINFYKLIFKL